MDKDDCLTVGEVHRLCLRLREDLTWLRNRIDADRQRDEDARLEALQEVANQAARAALIAAASGIGSGAGVAILLKMLVK